MDRRPATTTRLPAPGPTGRRGHASIRRPPHPTRPYGASARICGITAVTACRALALDGSCLRAKFDREPAFGLEMLQRFSQVLVQRLEATQLQLLDMYVGRP